jgi:endoglycosylceramidase
MLWDIEMRIIFLCCCLLLSMQLSAQKTYLTAKGTRFIDSTGREVMLHGLNFVNKDKAQGYRYADDSLSLVKMRQWGINCIRLGVIWDALEPAPGKINEAYLQQLDQRIHWAARQGIYVLLDMHQDLYSNKYSDGAPDWATLDDGQPHYANPDAWDDSYFMSAAVQTAFDHFWQNKPAADSIGLQDHLVRNWALLAQRYAGEPAVIGFDLLNEPFIGSNVNKVLAAFMHALAAGSRPAISEEEVMKLWVTEAGKAQLMQQLDDTALFKQLIAGPEAYYAAFEKEQLIPYFMKAAAAIRAVNQEQLIFLEPSVSANLGVRTHIADFLQRYGTAKGIAFAPHAYDIVTDTRSVAGGSEQRMQIIFNRLDSVRNVMNVPMLLGEWGAFYGSDSTVLPAGDAIVKQLEQLRCGEIYWSYFNSLEEMAYFPLINRGYPAAVTGTLEQYHYDRKEMTLDVSWKNDPRITSPTMIYFPLPPHKLVVSGNTGPYIVRQNDENSAWILLKAIPGNNVRKLLIRKK